VGSNPTPSANLPFLTVSACLDTPQQSRVCEGIISPIVSRHMLPSQHQWGEEVGNGIRFPRFQHSGGDATMAHTGKLSAVEVTRAKGPAVLHDGGGLYLRVSATGAKSWVFRFQLDGKRRDMGLGPFPDISLAEARLKASAHRKQRHEGIDPLVAKAAQRQAQRLSVAKGRTFCECAVEFIEKNQTSAAVGEHARYLRLPHFGRIAGVGDRCWACGTSARSNLGNETGNGESSARADRGGTRRRDGAGLSSGAEPGTVERQPRSHSSGPLQSAKGRASRCVAFRRHA
jgi:hypothetical protein